MDFTVPYRRTSWVLSLMALALSVSAASSFFVEKNTEPTPNIVNRREFLHKAPVAVLSLSSITNIFSSRINPAVAADDGEIPSKEVVMQCFNNVRYELVDSQGGVSYMQGRIDTKDWVGLLEFTKSYDLELRKLRMGKAKKLLQDKDSKAKATEYANAVTFDLIGINRSSREGRENAELANRYLQQLREDLINFLALEDTINIMSGE